MKNLLLIAALAMPLATMGQDKMPERQHNNVSTKLATAKVQHPQKVTDWEDCGTVVTLLEEDFSKLTSGSEAEPDLQTDMYLDNGNNTTWDDMDPYYTHQPGWGETNVYPAGGMLYMNGNRGFASINTPMVDCSARDGLAILQFRAKAVEGKTAVINVDVVDTDNWGIDWKYYPSTKFTDVSDQWTTYEVVVKDCSKYMLFIIDLTYNNKEEKIYTPCYLDDVKVFQIEQILPTPQVLPHTEYKGTAFTANWSEVDGADYYLVNLYSNNPDTNSPELLRKDLKATTNSLEITDVVSGDTYYYTVRAVKGEYTSIESHMWKVYDLEAPVLNPTDGIAADNTFKASWTSVPSAESYNYWAFCERTAQKDGEFVVTDEDFSDIRKMDGTLSGWTFENPSNYSYETYYSNEMNQQGWRGHWAAPYTDYICLDGFKYVDHTHPGYQPVGLISPDLDLSKDEGRCTMSVELLGEEYYNYDYNNILHEGITQAYLCLYNWNEAQQDFVEAERKDLNDVDIYWKEFSAQFTKGTKRSRLAVHTADDSYGNLYVDNLRVTQHYAAGETLLDPFRFICQQKATEATVKVPDHAQGLPLYHQVTAVKIFEDGYKESQPSQLLEVPCANGIDALRVSDRPFTLSADGRMAFAQGHGVRVCRLDGSVVYANTDGGGSLVLTQHGVYIVTVAQKSWKIVF